jgi:hypothetical protein
MIHVPAVFNVYTCKPECIQYIHGVLSQYTRHSSKLRDAWNCKGTL